MHDTLPRYSNQPRVQPAEVKERWNGGDSDSLTLADVI